MNWSDKIAGENGKSAFDIAKDGGFEGTEEEWLKSLKGTNGGNPPNVDYIILELPPEVSIFFNNSSISSLVYILDGLETTDAPNNKALPDIASEKISFISLSDWNWISDSICLFPSES